MCERQVCGRASQTENWHSVVHRNVYIAPIKEDVSLDVGIPGYPKAATDTGSGVEPNDIG